jgi:hypothetical protein
MKIKKTVDEDPILTYKGRRIEIESGGLGQNTVLKVDGKVMNNIVFFTIFAAASKPVRVEIGMLDLL